MYILIYSLLPILLSIFSYTVCILQFFLFFILVVVSETADVQL